jgi:hypothetical protein
LRLLGLGDHLCESSDCEKQADDRHDLRQIKEENAFQGIFGSVPKLSDEQDRRERRDTKISDQTVDFHERRAGDVENDEIQKTEKRIDEREGNDRRGVGIRTFGFGIRDSKRKGRRLSVYLPSDERPQVPHDSREEKGENHRVKIFSEG